MVSCSILGCKSRSELKQAGITFHAFPIDTLAKNKWIQATGRIDWQPSIYSRICSVHFESHLLTKRMKRTVLFRDALPSKNVHVLPATSSSMNVIMTDGLPNTPSSLNAIMADETPNTSSLMDIIMTDKTPSISLMKSTLDETPDKNSMGDILTEKLGTPQRLMEKLKRQRILSEKRLKKLRAVSQKKRRLEKKVANLEHIVVCMTHNIS